MKTGNWILAVKKENEECNDYTQILINSGSYFRENLRYGSAISGPQSYCRVLTVVKLHTVHIIFCNCYLVALIVCRALWLRGLRWPSLLGR
jgi:hypothetical protein